jgi:TP901 family phage tail tape measure protein
MSRFSINAELRIQAPSNLNSVVNNIRQQLAGITATVNIVVPPQAQRNLANAQKNLQNITKNAQKATSSITTFGEQAALAGKRFAAFALVGGSFIKFTSAITQGVKEAIAFEREMNKIAQATGSSAKSVSQISSEISRLSTTFGVSSTQLSKASLVLAQAGLSAKDTAKSLQALAKTDLAPTFDSIIDTTEGAIAIFQQFGVTADSLESSLSSMNSVAAKFAVESGDIIAAVRRTGGAFKAAGGNLNELMALFTSVRATTRESAESIATGFRTIFTRLQRVRTQNFLKTVGIDLQDIEGQFVGPYEAIRRLSTAMKSLKGTDPRFAQIIEELGGFRQISKVIPLIQQFETSQRALNVAMVGSSSLSEDAARAQESLAVQITKVKEQFAAMIRQMTDSSAFKGMVNLALKLAESFIKIATALTPLLPMLTILGSISLGKAIGPFMSGFKGKGGFGFFAKGGLVPGQGNQDTVPAMLTPGEYVIRKDAVNALGLNRGGRVPRVQKFMSGTIVKKPTYTSIGSQTFEEQKDSDKFAKQAVGGIFLRTPLGNDSSGLLERGILKVKTKNGIEDVKFTAAGFSNDFETQFESKISNSMIELSNHLGKMMASELGAKQDNALVRKSQVSNLASITGGLFESAISSLGPPFTEDQATFDFPKGLGVAAGKWNNASELTSIPVDAKRTWNAKSKQEIAEKAAAIINSPDLLNISKRTEWSKGQDLPKALADKIKSKNLEEKIRYLRDQDYNFDFIPPNTSGPNTPARFIGKKLGGLISRFAAGGQVPALLTPGELVIDKNTANALGSDTLNQLNYADKFANGGFAPKPAAGFIDRNLGDIRRARRRRLDESGSLTPQAKYLAKRRSERFAQRRGAPKIAQVFDFDDTLAITGAKSFKDFSGSVGKTLIDSAAATQYAIAAKAAAEQGQHVFVLTARTSDSAKPIQRFASRAGIQIPMSRIITVADNPEVKGLREPGAKAGTTRQAGTATKKAAILQRLASQYEKVVFTDDNKENVLKAASIKGVSSVQAAPQRVRGFKRGGAVGRVRKFAKGGSVGGLGGIASAGLLTSGLSALVGTFNGLNESVDKAVGAITSLSTQFVLMQAVTSQVSGSFRQLDISRGILKKQLEERRGIKKEIRDTQAAGKPNGILDGMLAKVDAKIGRTKAFAKFAPMLGIGIAAGASTFGPMLEDAGRKRVQEGRGGEFMFLGGSAVSSAGSMASVGAGIGSLFGPLGTAIGGAAGALVGLTKGFFDAQKELANIKIMKSFNESMTKTVNILDALSSGKTTFSAAQQQVKSQAKNFFRDIQNTDTSGASRQDIVAQIKNSLDKFATYLNMATQDVNSFDEFIGKAGEDVFNLVADLSNRNTADLKKEYSDIIESNKKLRASQERLIVVQDDYANQVRNIINVTQAFETVAMNMQGFDRALDRLAQFAEGTASSLKFLDESARLGSPDKFFDQDAFNRVLNRDITNNPLLQGGVGASMSADVAEAAKATQALPSVLLKLRNNLTEIGDDNVIEKLMNEFKDAPPIVRNAIENAARGIMGSEAKEGLLIERVQKDLQGVSKELSESFKPIFETAQMISAKTTEELNRRSEFANKLAELTMKEIEARNRTIDIMAQSEDILSQAERRPADLNKLQNLDTAKQRNILGADAGMAGNATAITNALLSTQSALESTQAELERQGAGASDELRNQQQAQIERIKRLNNALEFLADVSGRTSVSMKKLELAQKGADFKRGIAEKLTFAESPQEIKDMALQIAATRKAVEKGSINAIPPQFRQDVEQMLDQIGELRPAFLGGMSGVEAKTQLVAQRLMDVAPKGTFTKEEAMNIAKGQTSETQKIVNEIQAQTTQAQAASTGLTTVLSANKSAYVAKFNESIEELKNIQKILLQQQAKNIEEQIATAGGAKEKTERARAGLSRMREVTGLDVSEERTVAAGNAIDLFKKLKKDRENIPKLQGFVDAGAVDNTFIDLMNSSMADVADFSSDEAATIISKERERLSADVGGNASLVAKFDQLLRNNAQQTNGRYGASALAKTIDDARKAVRQDAGNILIGGSDTEKTLKEMGYNDQIINSIISGLEKFEAGLAEFKLDPRTSRQLQDSMNEIELQVETFKTNLTDLNTAIENSKKAPKALPDVPKAFGGWVHGRGLGDTIPARLTPGEFVLSRKMVHDIGKDNVAQMAGGGFVDKVKEFFGITSKPKSEADKMAEMEKAREEEAREFQQRQNANPYNQMRTRESLRNNPLFGDLFKSDKQKQAERLAKVRTEPLSEDEIKSLAADRDESVRERRDARRQATADRTGRKVNILSQEDRDKNAARAARFASQHNALKKSAAEYDAMRQKMEKTAADRKTKYVDMKTGNEKAYADKQTANAAKFGQMKTDMEAARKKRLDAAREKYAPKTKEVAVPFVRDSIKFRDEQNKLAEEREQRWRARHSGDIASAGLSRDLPIGGITNPQPTIPPILQDFQDGMDEFRQNELTPEGRKKNKQQHQNMVDVLGDLLKKAEGGIVFGKGYTVNGITYKDYDDYFEQTTKKIKSSNTSPEVFKANVEKIKADSAASQKESAEALARIQEVNNRGYLETIKADIADPNVGGIQKTIAASVLPLAYGMKGAEHISGAAVGGVKTGLYAGATGVVKAAHLGQSLHGIEDPYLDDLDRRLSSLTEATASDLRGNLSFGLAGTQGAEREQLSGGVGFSKDFTEGQKLQSGISGTLLDTAIGIGMSPMPGTTFGKAAAIQGKGLNLQIGRGVNRLIQNSGMSMPKVGSGIGGALKNITGGVKGVTGKFKSAKMAKLKNIAAGNRQAKLAKEYEAFIQGIKGRSGTLATDLDITNKGQGLKYLEDFFNKFKIDKKLLPKDIKFGNAPFNKDPNLKNALAFNRGRDIYARSKGVNSHILKHEGGHGIKNALQFTKGQESALTNMKQPLIERLNQVFNPKNVASYLGNNHEVFAEIMANAESMPKMFRALRKIGGFKSGSIVPGSGSGDKVPALLEPGEFVLNRNAVSAVGAGRLSHINKKFGRFKSGGPVKMQEGGLSGGGSYTLDASQMNQAVQNFGTVVDKFTETVNSMVGLSIDLKATHDVNVVFNGLEIMASLEPTIQSWIAKETDKAIKVMLDKRFNLPPQP